MKQSNMLEHVPVNQICVWSPHEAVFFRFMLAIVKYAINANSGCPINVFVGNKVPVNLTILSQIALSWALGGSTASSMMHVWSPEMIQSDSAGAGLCVGLSELPRLRRNDCLPFAFILLRLRVFGAFGSGDQIPTLCGGVWPFLDVLDLMSDVQRRATIFM
jgi:hypothetical protein